MIELPIGGWGQRGTWHGTTISSLGEMTGVLALVRCPTCAGDAAIPGHKIEDDGATKSPFICPLKCGFGKAVKLVGWAQWKAEVMPPGSGESGPRSSQ